MLHRAQQRAVTPEPHVLVGAVALGALLDRDELLEVELQLADVVADSEEQQEIPVPAGHRLAEAVDVEPDLGAQREENRSTEINAFRLSLIRALRASQVVFDGV